MEEWSSFPYSPLDEDLYGLLSPPLSEWTSEENEMLENAVTDMDPSSPAFFQKVAAKIPWKTVEEVKLHYQSLLNDGDKNVEGEESPPPRKRKTKTGQPRRRGVPWTEDEHQLFLMGLNKYGKGDWRSISRYYVINKTSTQVASHAQKFFRRRTSCTPPDRRRPSIHDVQTVNPPTSALITSIHHNSNGGAPLSSVFPSAVHPVFNGQIAPASCFLMNPNWG